MGAFGHGGPSGHPPSRCSMTSGATTRGETDGEAGGTIVPPSPGERGGIVGASTGGATTTGGGLIGRTTVCASAACVIAPALIKTSKANVRAPKSASCIRTSHPSVVALVYTTALSVDGVAVRPAPCTRLERFALNLRTSDRPQDLWLGFRNLQKHAAVLHCCATVQCISLSQDIRRPR